MINMGIEEKLDGEEVVSEVKIPEIPVPKDENELINYFRNLRDTREFCVQLVMYSISKQFDPQKIYGLCTREERQKIGYLSDIILTLKKDRVLEPKTTRNLNLLSKIFQDGYKRWVHVSASSDFVRGLMEKELKWVPHPEINHRWKVYPTVRAEDVLDMLDLYHKEYFNGRENISEEQARELLYKKKGFRRLRL